MDILLNKQHELRSGWKFLAYWILFIVILFAVSLAIPIQAPITQLERLILNTIPTIPAVAALVLMARFVDRAPVARFGATLHEKWPHDLTVGLAVAGGMLAILTLINGAFGGIRMAWTASDASSRSLMVTPIVFTTVGTQPS